MGGRGSNSSLIGNVKPVSSMMARVYYNAAKKSDALRRDGTVKRDSRIERAIKTENTEFISKISNEKEARRVKEYLTDRIGENDRKLAKMGSAEAVQKDQKTAIERRKLLSMKNAAADKMSEFSKRPEAGNTNMHDTSRTTTTYDRARKRRMKNFDSWFYGNKG